MISDVLLAEIEKLILAIISRADDLVISLYIVLLIFNILIYSGFAFSAGEAGVIPALSRNGDKT